jgi:cytochrome c556
VRAKNVDGLRKAGDQLVLTCINCHKEYKLDVPKIWSDHEAH